MKIYSETLTEADLRKAPPAGTSLTKVEAVSAPRPRTHAWKVQLGRAGSRRPFNSGTFGADGEGAASWDDWGWFLSALYQRDPQMIAGGTGLYKDAGDFHAKTHDTFR